MQLSLGRRSYYVDEDVTGTLQIEACQQRQCFSVGIVDSNQLEEEESFDISLLRNGLNINIHIGPQSITTITIQDDDSKLDSKACFPMYVYSHLTESHWLYLQW